MLSPDFPQLIADVATLSHLGMRVLFIFGAGPQFDEKLSEKSIPFQRIHGRRLTTKEMIPVLQEITNTDAEKIIQLLKKDGVIAERIEPFLSSKKLNESGFPEHHNTGYISNVDTRKIQNIIHQDTIGLCFSLVDEYNCNADDIVLELAKSLGAEKVLFLTGTKGVFVLEDGKKKFLTSITPKDVETHIEKQDITGGMIPKVRAACRIAEVGIPRVHIISGLHDGTLLTEMFTSRGSGTMIATSFLSNEK